MNRKVIGLAVAVAFAPTAHSAGFYLKEQSIVSQGAAFAGAAAQVSASTLITSKPLATARRTTAEPMNPAPPVIKSRILFISQLL